MYALNFPTKNKLRYNNNRIGTTHGRNGLVNLETDKIRNEES